MAQQKPEAGYDSLVAFSDIQAVKEYEDTAMLGEWFVFLKSSWFQRPEIAQLAQLLQPSGDTLSVRYQAKVLFRGKDTIALPGVKIAPKPLPRVSLISLTADKALYRAGRDTIRLLIAAPQQPAAQLTLQLKLSGNPYASYPLVLDEYGLCLWSVRDLPEGEYVATLVGTEVEACRFEVAEYRLAALNVELVEQQLRGDVLHYVLAVSSFNQPYVGALDVELQERGQRVGRRGRLHCDRSGRCRSSVTLSGSGPFTLNILAGERTATVALKGSEQQRRETLTISSLGEIRALSLLPAEQSNSCRGMYVTRGGTNTEPFLVRRVIGRSVEIVPRVTAEALCVVLIDPVKGVVSERLYGQTAAEQVIELPMTQPYGIVLLGAVIEGEAWEGWCAVLRPSDLQLECEAPAHAKPGSRIKVTLRAHGMGKDGVVPVQMIVKDQRLMAASDPQMELAACIKQHLGVWSKTIITGEVTRQLSTMVPTVYGETGMHPMMMRASYATGMQALPLPPPMMPMPLPPTFFAPPPPPTSFMAMPTAPAPQMAMPTAPAPQMAMPVTAQSVVSRAQSVPGAASSLTTLTKMRVQFPEVVYNEIVKVRGETSVEVTLGDSLTRYSIEAFALVPETMDWQRVEASVDVEQAVYGELTISPFVFPGDPVMGRLDVGASSGAAIVEVRHDDELLPLLLDDGSMVTPGLPIPSGSVVSFPVRPGAFTATVRDARTGESDVSVRYVTAPGQMRHITRRLQLLNVGDELSLQLLRAQNVLDIQPLPALERPFQLFIEGAISYPFGCIEQSASKLLAMFAGYIVYQNENEQLARSYEEVIPAWCKRVESMYLPDGGFSFYPPQAGESRRPDMHYGPAGVKYLLQLPSAEHSGIKSPGLLDWLREIRTMVVHAAKYYQIDVLPRKPEDCHTAYQIITSSASTQLDRAAALNFVRSRLVERNGQAFVEVGGKQSSFNLFGSAVGQRVETAYAAAALLAGREQSDLKRVLAATNYLTGQINESGRLYSTADTVACLLLLLGLREAGIVSGKDAGRVALNGREMTLAEALAVTEKVESLRCVDGVVAVQLTCEVHENWSTFKSKLAVEVRLEKRGQTQQHFTVGDELDLVIRVPHYEAGLLAHICLPDALVRIVGGGQVKRFSVDFSEKNELRVPLAVIGTTSLPLVRNAEKRTELMRWLAGSATPSPKEVREQRWAVIVRNMFKEEQIGNPGILTVQVE